MTLTRKILFFSFENKTRKYFPFIVEKKNLPFGGVALTWTSVEDPMDHPHVCLMNAPFHRHKF